MGTNNTSENGHDAWVALCALPTHTHVMSFGNEVCPSPTQMLYNMACNNNNNMKCFVIPVIIGATGIVSKSLQKYLETHSIDFLQKLPY
jgi:hypothetical protein